MAKYKYILVGAFLLSLNIFGQSVDLSGVENFNEGNYGLTKKDEENADLLVNKLTQGKTGEKEKFDAIFAWVARNIFYNYREYFSSGSSPKSVQTILKYKRAICLGYATLMDTLCAKAGITNVSVYGYAKDEIFDVNDSLYMDNHAWNAVKLDGEWFVYDVTWSTGKYEKVLTRFSRFKKKLQQKFKPKYKNKKLKPPPKGKYKSACKQNTGPAYYPKQRFFNRLWQRIVFSLKLKGKIRRINGATTDFYLAQPEVFGITHHADDPAWNLLPGKTIQQFEKDSAYYYLTDSVYKTQQRYGSNCPECDAVIAASSRRAQLKHLKDTSAKSNQRNHFITALCWTEMAEILVTEQETETDDSLRLKKIIGAEKEFNEGWKQYGKASRSVTEETTFQRIKNRKKVEGLGKEDNLHNKKAGLRFAKCNKYKRFFKRISSKSRAYIIASGKKINRIYSTGKGMSAAKPGKNAELNCIRIRKVLEEEEKNVDSLDKLITVLKERYDSVLTNLSLNAGQMGKPLDSLQQLFLVRLYERALLQDDLKKPVVDLKKKIMSLEKFHEEQVKQVVFSPSDTAVRLFSKVYGLVKLRQQKQEACVKQMRDLVKNDGETPASFMTYKADAAKIIELDICWFIESGFSSQVTQRGLKFMAVKEKQLGTLLRSEVHTERLRGHYTDLELNRRYIKHNRIARHNIRVIRTELKKLKPVKRDVQKRLKKKQQAK